MLDFHLVRGSEIKTCLFWQGQKWCLQRAVAAPSLRCDVWLGDVLHTWLPCLVPALLPLHMLLGRSVPVANNCSETGILLRVLCCAGPIKHHNLLCQARLLHS